MAAAFGSRASASSRGPSRSKSKSFASCGWMPTAATTSSCRDAIASASSESASVVRRLQNRRLSFPRPREEDVRVGRGRVPPLQLQVAVRIGKDERSVRSFRLPDSRSS